MNKRINFDDDLVIVRNPEGEIDYKGMQDDNPYKREDWTFNAKSGSYFLVHPVYGRYTMEKIG